MALTQASLRAAAARGVGQRGEGVAGLEDGARGGAELVEAETAR